MSFAVLRYGKLKSFAKIAATQGHNLRERPTPNADPQAKVLIIHGTGDIEGRVRAEVAKCTKPPRKDAVLAVETVLSASPEYFRPGDPLAAGKYDHERMKAWTLASLDWLKQRHGSNLVSVVLHLDEVTPHLQAIIVPLDHKADGTVSLNAKELIGGPARLRADQSGYAQSLAHLGISRGRPKAETAATHTNIKDWYEKAPKDAEKAVNSAKNEVKDLIFDPLAEHFKTLQVRGTDIIDMDIIADADLVFGLKIFTE